jgi:hypothetical protein
VEAGNTSRRDLHSENDNKLDTSRLRKRRGIDSMHEGRSLTRRDSNFGRKDSIIRTPKNEESGFGMKDQPKPEIYEGSFKLDNDEGKPVPEPTTPTKNKKSLFDLMAKRRASERINLDLTKDQLNLIEDKSNIEKPKHRFSVSVAGDRGRPMTANKFLNAISRIAAKRDNKDDENGSSANKFAKALVKNDLLRL